MAAPSSTSLRSRRCALRPCDRPMAPARRGSPISPNSSRWNWPPRASGSTRWRRGPSTPRWQRPYIRRKSVPIITMRYRSTATALKRNWRRPSSSGAASARATSPARCSRSTAVSMPRASDCRRCGGSGETDDGHMSVMRIVFTLFVAVALWFFATMLARAEVRILASPGGQVGPFIDLFEKVKNSGERVVIDGPCLSACTLVLSMVPSERICVTRRAVLGFHAARSMDRRGRLYDEPAASKLVLQAYPGPVRDWIVYRGGLTSRLLLLRGRELTTMYRPCR